MKREWQAAIISWKSPDGRSGGSSLAFRVEHEYGKSHWQTPTLGQVADSSVTDARPLAVIDPEDTDQVELLLEPLRRMRFGAGVCGDLAAMQAALREFANPKPPKPEEPTGWGAVVEASDGWLWTLIAPDSKMWANYGARGYRTYDEIDVVRIVGEGVTP